MEGMWTVLRIESFMTPRLLKVAEMIKSARCVADIGTDHAYVPVYLVLNGYAESAIAMDINKGPLMRAEENIKKFSLTEKIKTRLCDGMKSLDDNEADAVIIAGMGGVLINSILENDKDRLTSVKQYVLQPMTAVEETRRYLAQNGFMITDERLAKEEEKIYTIILATRGKMEIEKEVNFYVGEHLIKNKDEVLPEFLDAKIYEYKKAINSMENAKKEETKDKLKKFEALLEGFIKIREECSKW